MQKRRCRARLLLGPGTINNNLYVFPRPSRLQRSSAGDQWQNTVMYLIVLRIPGIFHYQYSDEIFHSLDIHHPSVGQ